jgi:hypothetical protein
MIRRVLTFASLLSLLLCIAAAGLWVHSYFTGDALTWAAERMTGRRFEYRNVAVYSVRGGAWVNYGYYARELSAADAAARRTRGPTLGVSQFDYPIYPHPMGDAEITLPNLLGFHVGWNGARDPATQTTNSTFGVVIPYWFCVVFFGAVPLRFLWRRKRGRPNRCLGCGYDLRATPDRCPECGRVTHERPGTMGLKSGIRE